MSMAAAAKGIQQAPSTKINRMSHRYTLLRPVCAAIYACFLLHTAGAQSTLVTGRVTDASTGEVLVGVSVFCPEYNKRTATDAYGLYKLSLPEGPDSLTVVFRYISYDEGSVRLAPASKVKADFRLLPAGQELKEVVIQGNSDIEDKKNSVQMSVTTLSMREAKALPALFGEVDLIKILQLKPGIIPGPEGTSGLFVRGGNSDQNLIQLDNNIIYNPNHLFGFFSTFNPDATEDVTVYKGGFPAQYGGRLSSVIDVRMREGNKDKIRTTGGLGLISSRLTIDGPIQKGKHSFLISGRRTYADLITNAINQANRNNPNYSPIPGYYFYDLNGKLDFSLGPKDRLSIGGYHGRDVFTFKDINFDIDFNWGNTATYARWTHLFSDKLSVNSGVYYSRYQYTILNTLDGFFFRAGSDIRDVSLKTDFLYVPNARHTFRWGATATHHQFGVARLKAGSTDGAVSFSAGQDFTSMEYGLYAGDEWKALPRLTLNYGLRLSGWTNSPATFVRTEPRLSGVYQLSADWSAKASYARMFQYAHLLASSGLSLPTDLWYPSTSGIRPQSSDQVAAGLSYLHNKKYLFTLEAWYKKLGNQVDLIDGAEIFSTPNLETQLAIGQGYAFSPLELEIEKKSGKLTGWIGYTLAWVRRGDFPDIDSGNYFPPRFDTRHNASIVGIYELNRRWQLTGTFVYTSGYASWLPQGRFSLFDIPGAPPQTVVPIYGPRNTFRYPAYMRLDLGAVYRFTAFNTQNDLTLSIYNATGRRNPYFIFLEPTFQQVQTGNQVIKTPVGIAARQVSLFPALPSITWNFKF